MGRRKRKQKNKAIRIIFFLIFLVCLIIFIYLYKDEIILYLNSYLPPEEEKTEGNDEPTIIVSDELQIHFLELGNKNAGDCSVMYNPRFIVCCDKQWETSRSAF